MDNAITQLLALFQAACGARFKKYYYGKILKPNALFSPFVSVFPVSSSYNGAGSNGIGGTLSQTFRENIIKIQVVLNVKDYLTKQDKSTIESIKELVQYIEKITAGNTMPDSNTIIGVILNNPTIGGSVDNISSISPVQYDEDLIDESYFVYATITIATKEILPKCL